MKHDKNSLRISNTKLTTLLKPTYKTINSLIRAKKNFCK